MPISPLPQAPYRQDRKIFPTPLVTDVLFSEIRDCTRTEFPEYGTPHPNATKWPHHKLIFIKSVDIERDGLFEFFDAADRENQDLYNYQFQQADVGGTKFDSVVRTYVSARSDFSPTKYAMGAEMSSDPNGDVPEPSFLRSHFMEYWSNLTNSFQLSTAAMSEELTTAALTFGGPTFSM